MAKHEWKEFGGDIRYPFRRLRECVQCGAVQQWTVEHLWMRVTGYRWYPNAGRCQPGRALKDATGRDELLEGKDKRRWMTKGKR